MSTKGVFGLLGTFSFSCVAYSSAVGVLLRKRNPDFGFSPDDSSLLPFLYLLFVGEVMAAMGVWGRSPL